MHSASGIGSRGGAIVPAAATLHVNEQRQCRDAKPIHAASTAFRILHGRLDVLVDADGSSTNGFEV
jgi:hypothetical protein